MVVPRPKLNVVELLLLGLMLAAIAYVGGRLHREAQLSVYLSGDVPELQALEQRYGSARNSFNGEEWIIRDFFQDERGGVFLDVGANHHQRFSNTFFLEKTLGWSGIAVEPQQKFAADYAAHRPRTTLVPLFVSDTANREATLFVPANDLVASADQAFATMAGAVTPTKVMTTTIDDILDRQRVTRLDFMSLDIELGEPAALAGFSIERFRPRLVAVEAHPPVRQQLLDYFARHGYVLVGKYWQTDHSNFWFAPLADERR